jgi:hypothetical protein
MLNIQKDIIDLCQVILKMIDVTYESSEDITVMVHRSDKIKGLSMNIGQLMVKFEELGSVINNQEELSKVYATIKLFENDIPAIKQVIENEDNQLPEQIKNISLANVKKNLKLLETRLDKCIDDIRVNLKVLDNVIIKEKVPDLSGLMGRLYGEEVIDEVQKAVMNEDARTIMDQINESCNNVVTNLNNVVTLTIGAINYITIYFELLIKSGEHTELASMFEVIKIKQEKVRQVLT